MTFKKLDRALLGVGIVYSGLTSGFILTAIVKWDHVYMYAGLGCMCLMIASMLFADDAMHFRLQGFDLLLAKIISVPAYLVYTLSVFSLWIVKFVRGLVSKSYE